MLPMLPMEFVVMFMKSNTYQKFYVPTFMTGCSFHPATLFLLQSIKKFLSAFSKDLASHKNMHGGSEIYIQICNHNI
jgi:hypothetical protein